MKRQLIPIAKLLGGTAADCAVAGCRRDATHVLQEGDAQSPYCFSHGLTALTHVPAAPVAPSAEGDA